EFKIRLLKQEAVKAGCGNDCIVLMLDLNDRLAREIYQGESRTEAGRRRIGQPVRPGDTLQLVATNYTPIRENFSPDHRNVFDGCAPDDIRVAFLSEGRTMAMIIPADIKLSDLDGAIVVQGK